MRIKLSNFVIIVFCVGAFGLTNAVGLVSWSRSQDAQQNHTPEQLLDRDMDRAASRLYRDALKYYDEMAYWKSARELIILLDYYPAFSHADGVLCYLGESMYEMTMYKSAAKIFNYLLTKYPQSEYAGQALYGMQRIYYQTTDYAESMKIFSAISTRFPNVDIIDGACYHAGMAQYHQRDYDNAIATLSKVRSRSEYFDHSLYTIGLAYLKKKRSTRPSSPCASCLACRSFDPNSVTLSTTPT